MALPAPTTLSPSKIASFKSCALAFRFSIIDRLPEPPSVPAVKGTLVHSALERLFWNHPPGQRSVEAGVAELSSAWEILQEDPEVIGLALTAPKAAAFVDDAEVLLRKYFEIEDPNQVDAVGVELMLETELNGLRLRGIIDRLDRAPDGSLVVIDYKTGRAPSESHEQSRLGGVHFYSLLCEQVLGIRPSEVRLLYLRQPLVITATASDQTVRGLKQQTTAMWSAIQRACDTEDFRPKPSTLCSWCSFQAYCPAFGGDPSSAPTSTVEPGARPGSIPLSVTPTPSREPLVVQ
jgi:putative RecB family exonuclease